MLPPKVVSKPSSSRGRSWDGGGGRRRSSGSSSSSSSSIVEVEVEEVEVGVGVGVGVVGVEVVRFAPALGSEGRRGPPEQVSPGMGPNGQCFSPDAANGSRS